MKTDMEFVQQVVRCVRFFPDRSEISRELLSHLADCADELCEQEGLTPEAAHEEAVRRMGDPAEIGQALDRVHHPLLGWTWMLSRVLCILAVCLIGLPLALSTVGGGLYTLVQGIEWTLVPFDYGEPVTAVTELDLRFTFAHHVADLQDLAVGESGAVYLRYTTRSRLNGVRGGWSLYSPRVTDADGNPLNSGGSSSGGWIRYSVLDFEAAPGDTVQIGWRMKDASGKDAYCEIVIPAKEGTAA